MCLVFRTVPRLSEMEGFGSSGSKAGLERSLQELSEGVLQSIVQVSSKMESTWDHRTWTVLTSVFPQLVPSRRMHLVGRAASCVPRLRYVLVQVGAPHIRASRIQSLLCELVALGMFWKETACTNKGSYRVQGCYPKNDGKSKGTPTLIISTT